MAPVDKAPGVQAPRGLTPSGMAAGGMAAGGMGDVLAGLIGGFLSKGLSPWQASCLGVYSHGLAGDRLAEETSAGYLASELADQIPFILEDLRH